MAVFVPEVITTGGGGVEARYSAEQKRMPTQFVNFTHMLTFSNNLLNLLMYNSSPGSQSAGIVRDECS